MLRLSLRINRLSELGYSIAGVPPSNQGADVDAFKVIFFIWRRRAEELLKSEWHRPLLGTQMFESQVALVSAPLRLQQSYESLLFLRRKVVHFPKDFFHVSTHRKSRLQRQDGQSSSILHAP